LFEKTTHSFAPPGAARGDSRAPRNILPEAKLKKKRVFNQF